MFDQILKIFGLSNGKKEQDSRRVLIVEDNEKDRRNFNKVVTRLGHSTFLAENAQQGLEIVHREKPDLILLNCHLPGMSGIEMCKQLRDEPDTKDTPVLFLADHDTPKDILECFELDAENFLAKPVTSGLLASQVRSALKEHSPKKE